MTADADQRSTPHFFVPFDPGAEVSKKARDLPHWKQEGCTYFVTFRLADSMSQGKLEAWQHAREIWLRQNPAPWNEQQRKFYSKEFGERLQQYLDAGYGSCILSQPACAKIVADSLHYYDGKHYDLGDYVIMPNHVHLLVTPRTNFSLPTILQAWKGFTAKEINRLLGRKGTIWLDESVDHIVRNSRQLVHFQGYIRQNPIMAGLKPSQFLLGCGTQVVQVSPPAGANQGPAPDCAERPFASEGADQRSAPWSLASLIRLRWI